MSLKLFAALTIQKCKFKIAKNRLIPKDVVPWTRRCTTMKTGTFDSRPCSHPANADCNHEVCLYLVDKNEPESLAHVAAELGRLDVLIRTGEDKRGWSGRVIENAAESGHLGCLSYLIDNRCPVDESAPAAAALGGHIECLMFLHEKNCPWDSETTKNAAKNGHLSCLAYAHEHGCPDSDEAMVSAARGGHIDCLRYCHKNRFLWDAKLVSAAASAEDSACLEYLVENGFPMDSGAIEAAAFAGNLRNLQILHEHGRPWTWNVTQLAAQAGNTDCLRYACERGCPVDRRAMDVAVLGGHVDCIKYLIRRFDLKREHIQTIISHGHFETLRQCMFLPGWPFGFHVNHEDTKYAITSCILRFQLD